jgi:predicted metal-dependent peptidase
MLMFGRQLTVEQRMQRALSDIMAHPRYIAMSGVLMIGRREIVDGLPTAGTDGVNEYYGREFCADLTDPELRFLIIHETYHKLYKHLTTWQHLWRKNKELANSACDYCINIQIADDNKGDSFAVMPTWTAKRWGALEPSEREFLQKQGIGPGGPMGLIEERFRSMDSARIFYILEKEQEEKGGGDWGGERETGFDEHDWEAAQALNDDEKREIARQLDSALRQGALVAGKMRGSGDRALGELLEPQVDWREVLREFVSIQVAGKDYSTWRRPNRRYVASGLYLPSGLTEKVGEVVLAVDTSGSISEELKQFLCEVKCICETVKPSMIHLLYWGGSVVGHEKYKESEIDKLVQSTQPKDGGGTVPSCIPAYMRSEGLNPQAVIVFTDGHVGGDWGGHWDVPVLWCIVGNENAHPTTGQYVHVEL